MPEKHNPLADSEGTELNLLELLHIVVKRKKIIVIITATAFVASVAFSISLPNIYSATAKVLPPQKEGGGGLSALLGQAGGLAGLAAGGLSGGSDLYLGILKSRSVADEVIKRLDLSRIYNTKQNDETRRKLSAAVKAQAGKDGIISITAEDRDPKLSALLANTFVDELIRMTIRLNLTKAGTERVFLEKRLELVKQDLKKAEEDLRGFAQQNKVVQVDSQAKATIEGVARMKAELVNKEVQLATLRSYQTDESPEVKAAQAAIRKLQGEIGRTSGRGLDDAIPSIGNVPGLGLDYARKMRELKIQESVFEQLTKQYEMAKLGEAKDSSSLQVLDEAVVPLKKTRPKRSLIVVMTTIAAVLLSVCVIFVREYVDRMSKDDRETLRRIRTGLLPSSRPSRLIPPED